MNYSECESEWPSCWIRRSGAARRNGPYQSSNVSSSSSWRKRSTICSNDGLSSRALFRSAFSWSLHANCIQTRKAPVRRLPLMYGLKLLRIWHKTILAGQGFCECRNVRRVALAFLLGEGGSGERNNFVLRVQTGLFESVI